MTHCLLICSNLRDLCYPIDNARKKKLQNKRSKVVNLNMVKLKRTVSSDVTSEEASIFLGGNIHEICGNVGSLVEDEEFEYSSHENNESITVDVEASKLSDYQKAGRICESVYGIDLLDMLTKLLISNQFDPKEFALQALAYRIQSVVRGVHGIRYTNQNINTILSS